MAKKTANKTVSDTVRVSADTKTVRCDGGTLGHPEVYYSFDGTNKVVCGYCGKTFIRNKKRA